MAYDGVNVNDKFGLYIKKKSKDYTPRARPFILTQSHSVTVIYLYLHNGVQHVKPVCPYLQNYQHGVIHSCKPRPNPTNLYQID